MKGKRRRPRGPFRGKGPQAGGPAPLICHADAHVVVVDKPAGLTTMRHPEEAAEFGARAQRYLPPTLADLLPDILRAIARRRPRKKHTPGPAGRESFRVIPVHRIDKDTSGLVVFARTPAAAQHLGEQFRKHNVDRSYLALVRGQAKAGRLESVLVRDRGDGRRGSAPPSSSSVRSRGEAGQHAVTHVRVVEEFGAYTLVECRLETGRTHQVRIHLGESGTPLCGERIYDRPLHGQPFPDESAAARPMLHAAQLGFTHPATGRRMKWEAPCPPDMQALIDRLRSLKRSESAPSGRG